MNISRENTGELNAVITLKITQDDYSGKVDEVLKDYKKKARIDGFRPGMVPLGLVKKLYYKPVLAEEINKLVGEKLMGYIREEKLRILGEPLPHESDEKQIDFDKDTEFEFSFDIGLYPEFTVDVAASDKIPYYKIKLDDEALEKTVSDVANRYGELTSVDQINGDEIITGNIFQSDDKANPTDNGLSVDEVNMPLQLIDNDKIRKMFHKGKKGDIITFDIRKAYNDEERIKTVLKLDKDKPLEIDGFFTLEITDIRKFKDHEINRELFDKVYGEGQVKTEEEFRNRIKDELTASYTRESEYRFTIDARDFYLKKADFNLPVEFLKRWLTETNDKINKEELDKDFSEYEDDFKWQLIKDQIIRANEIKVSEQEIQEYAVHLTRNQFYGYGMHNVPEEYMEKYAREQLANPESSRKIYDQRLTERVFTFIRDTVKTKEKEVTLDQFKKLFEK